MTCYGFRSPGERVKIPDCSLTFFSRSIRSGTFDSVLCDPTIINFFCANQTKQKIVSIIEKKNINTTICSPSLSPWLVSKQRWSYANLRAVKSQNSLVSLAISQRILLCSLYLFPKNHVISSKGWLTKIKMLEKRTVRVLEPNLILVNSMYLHRRRWNGVLNEARLWVIRSNDSNIFTIHSIVN